MGALPEASKVLPAGVDPERYLSTGDGSEIRKRHGLQAGDLVLFFMGWVYPFSGLREVAEALIAGVRREDRLKLLVVGKGDSWNELARLATERSAEDRIKMVDFRPYPEIPSYLAAADVCLLPAHNTETMRNIVPIKMYEYLAAGKPVIATKLPGVIREFGEGHGVVYVDTPDQVVAMAAKLREEGALRELGEQGKAFVSKNDWDSITRMFESNLRGLVERSD
jgi:glycosyltransferase involved in cell wall biosynthesis